MTEQSDAIRQFRLALTALIALVIIGTMGYHILEGWSLLDSLYMTVITLATVGYKEVEPLDASAKIFTICLILFGVTVVFWAGASLVEAIVGEQIWHAIQRKRMQKTISKLQGHYIICGFGRMGQEIVKDLQREDVPYVVIERNPEQMPKLIAWEIPFVEGNASDDKILRIAGIEHAKGLITVAPSDEDNVFITLSARALSKTVFIVARSILEENENKLKMAGANRVMSPYILGGRRMATAVLRPNVLDFLDLTLHTEELEMMIEEVTLPENSCFLGKTLQEADFKSTTGITILAIKKKQGSIIPNPSNSERLESGDVIIMLGGPQQLEEAEKMTCSI